MKSIFITFLLFICFQKSKSQEIKQVFVGEIIQEDTIPLIGATLFWLNSTIGATTNEKGIAELECIGKYPNKLVLNNLGYKTDTITILEDIPFFSLFMQSDNQLEEFVVESTLPSNFVEFLNPIKTEVIDASEFRKAACCNLSESFQTNATVDVGYNDAVTGSKEIMMLGLDGNYVQILTENQPLFRGLVQSFGLEYIPAAWMNKISVSKGISSVKNGYEGLTGAVNIENIQPFDAEKFTADLFFNHQGRTELFLSSGQKISKKTANTIFVGGSLNRAKWDENNDEFLDNPLTRLINFMDRIDIRNKKSEAQLSIKYAFEDRIGGQVKFDNKTDKGTTNAYGFGAKTNRLELAAKNGYFLSGNEFQSLGIQVSGVYHNMDAFYGLHKYIGKEYNGNLNLIYQNIIKNTNHKIAVGSSFMIDDLSEQLDSIVLKRTEIVPGIFGEYTYAFLEKITLLAGIRLDYHNQYGIQFTPRVHFRYSPTENTAIRINAGRGWRVSNPIAENISLLVSSRNLNILESLDKESGWNYGISFLQSFEIRKKTGSFALDFFRTDFTSQVIVDMDHEEGKINIYNLNGKSFSNSILAELNLEPIKNFTLKFAYKMDDVKSTMSGNLLPKFMISKHKGLFAASYNWKEKGWEFNANLAINGKIRLTQTTTHDPINHMDVVAQNFAPIFTTLNFQIKKRWKEWEFYIGGDNITNFKQKNPIINPENPFSSTFDGTQVWGPINGIIGYGGIRFTLL